MEIFEGIRPSNSVGVYLVISQRPGHGPGAGGEPGQLVGDGEAGLAAAEAEGVRGGAQRAHCGRAHGRHAHTRAGPRHPAAGLVTPWPPQSDLTVVNTNSI